MFSYKDPSHPAGWYDRWEKTREQQNEAKEEAFYVKNDVSGGEGQRGYKEKFLFRFCVEFKRKSSIVNNRSGKNYTEEVVLEEIQNPLPYWNKRVWKNKEEAEIALGQEEGKHLEESIHF